MNNSHTVVICTRDRVDEVLEFLDNLSKTTSFEVVRVIIVENSLSQENTQILRKLIDYETKLSNVTVIQSSPGLAQARNESLPLLAGDIVHFMDDDITLPMNYFEYIDEIFTKYPTIAGLAPHIESAINNSDFEIRMIVEKILGFIFRADGKLSKSGRARWIRKSRKHYDVEWLPGCCMAYRINAIVNNKFETGLENGPLGGYALGEDLDFSHQISKRAKLMGLGEISIEHKLAPNDRTNWIKMDEGIGRLRAFLLNKFPDDVRFLRVFLSLLLEGSIDFIRIKITREKRVDSNYVQFTRLRFFLKERFEPRLVKVAAKDEV